jgi:hypothetical protein
MYRAYEARSRKLTTSFGAHPAFSQAADGKG